MNFLLFLGPIIGVAVSIFAVVVIISVIGAVAGSEEDFDEQDYSGCFRRAKCKNSFEFLHLGLSPYGIKNKKVSYCAST